MNQTRTPNKESRARHAVTLTRIAAAVDGIAEVGPREVAIAAGFVWDCAGNSFHGPRGCRGDVSRLAALCAPQ